MRTCIIASYRRERIDRRSYLGSEHLELSFSERLYKDELFSFFKSQIKQHNKTIKWRFNPAIKYFK